MLDFHHFGPQFGAPDASPFCIKLEIFLRLARIPYERRPADLAEAPKGKAPYVRDEGRLIGDSELVMRHLERKHGIDLDQGLDPVARAVGHALCVMLEERTYFALVFNRWHEDDNWPIERATVLGDLPDEVCEEIRKTSFAELRGQGLGRHSAQEVYDLARADIDAVAAWLRGKPFIQGERPMRADCAVGAFVIALTSGPFRNPIGEAIAAHPHLVAYRDRLMRIVFPEFVAQQAA